MIYYSHFIFERGQHGSFFHLTRNRAPYLWAHISERVLSNGFKTKIVTAGDTERQAELYLFIFLFFLLTCSNRANKKVIVNVEKKHTSITVCNDPLDIVSPNAGQSIYHIFQCRFHKFCC